MTGNHFSLILLSTNQCNADCDYCFEDKSQDRLSLEQLDLIVDKVLTYMEEKGIGELTIHWQGGEALLLPPAWYAQAHEWIWQSADARGKIVRHGLQTNLLSYSPKWNRVIAEMFGNTVSTSFDYPNRHRKLSGRGPAAYTALWTRNVHAARAAGIEVKVISVLNPGTLDLGAERFYTYLVDRLGITDFQVNTPFPGGAANPVKQRLLLDVEALTRFHIELADLWLEQGYPEGIKIGPFDELLNYFTHQQTCLPCVWGQNCADEIVAVDARGYVAQCDCWVTSYPEYYFGNIFKSQSLTALLESAQPRQDFYARPVELVQRDCIDCDYLSLCHGGCPVRTYTVYGTLFEKDVYCGLYKALFAHMREAAVRKLSSRPAINTSRTALSCAVRRSRAADPGLPLRRRS